MGRGVSKEAASLITLATDAEQAATAFYILGEMSVRPEKTSLHPITTGSNSSGPFQTAPGHSRPFWDIQDCSSPFQAVPDDQSAAPDGVTMLNGLFNVGRCWCSEPAFVPRIPTAETTATGFWTEIKDRSRSFWTSILVLF